MKENRWKVVAITGAIVTGLWVLSFLSGVVRLYDFASFWSMLAILGVFVFSIFIEMAIAYEFLIIAEQKGHHDRRYFWLPFCLTIIGYLIVIALPDRGILNVKTVVPSQKTASTYNIPANQPYTTPAQPAYTAPQQPSAPVTYNDLPDL